MITLIEKEDKDRKLIKNSTNLLMNVDAKIAFKSLTIRIKEFLPQLFNCDQTAYVKGSNIGEGL